VTETPQGTLIGQDGTVDKPYNPSRGCYANGTRISVRLDCDAHTLTFAVNGAWLPYAWDDLPAVELFPAFEIYNSGCSFAVEPATTRTSSSINRGDV
jgi:hypothetical protein